MKYLVLDKILYFFAKDNVLYIKIEQENVVKVCECKNEETMRKKIMYIKGCLEKYYAAKTAHNQEFCLTYLISINDIVKQGEPPQ